VFDSEVEMMNDIWYRDREARELEEKEEALVKLLRKLERLDEHASDDPEEHTTCGEVVVLEQADVELAHCMRCGEPIASVAIGRWDDGDGFAVWCLDDHRGSGFNVRQESVKNAIEWVRDELNAVTRRLAEGGLRDSGR